MSDIVSGNDEAYRVYDESATDNSWLTRRGKPIYFVSPTKHICHLLKDGSFPGCHYWIVTNGDPMIFLSVNNPQTTKSFVYDYDSFYYKFYNVDYAESSFPASIA